MRSAHPHGDPDHGSLGIIQAASGLGHIANERHYDQLIELMNRIGDDGDGNTSTMGRS